MVMRNRHDGADTPNGRDDLPPGIRRRLANQSPGERFEPDEPHRIAGREPVANRASLIRDLTRLAALFVVVALANLLFLLIAITFLSSGGSLGP